MVADYDMNGGRDLLISMLNAIDSGSFSSNSFRVMKDSWM